MTAQAPLRGVWAAIAPIQQLHTVERITRLGLRHLVVEVTIDDPGAYAKAFTITSRSTLVPEDRVKEHACEVNEPSAEGLVRPARVR